jgi:leucyl/phenylalanyl-tRNA--protein transferase
MIRIPMLEAGGEEDFPPVERALREPDGLLCAGGDLGSERLLRAYRRGIFPWFNAGEPILWWSPDPRCVFDLGTLRPSRSLRRFARSSPWRISADRDFGAVMRGCAEPRGDGEGTWIDAQMVAAYTALHRLGHAHSVEVWEGAQLIGGVYGVALGGIFFGESMFSRASNASKIALFALARQLADWGFVLIDGQVRNPHLLGLGAMQIERAQFSRLLERHCAVSRAPGDWAAAWQITVPNRLDR